MTTIAESPLKNASDIDQDKCRDYIRRLETQEYIDQLKKGEIDPELEQPAFSTAEVKAAIMSIDQIAARTGKQHPVNLQIKNARQNSAFDAAYQGTDKKEEEAAKEEAYSNGPICPPLPIEAVLPPEASKGACD